MRDKQLIRLDIISDIACPWCYVGKAYLDRALEAHPEHPFEIEWHPFQLNPEMPISGMDRAEYMEKKFGGRENAVRAYAPLVEHAQKAGLVLNLGDVKRTPNTLNAHRLIHWAGLEGRQTPVVSALFRALWQEGRDIGDLQVLADVAEHSGLDRAMMLRLLEGDADREDISARDAHARERGVTGVPTFILANQHVLQGAQPSEVWGRIIEELTEQLNNPAKNSAV
ncbi:MAG: DsbA family oxidoreductase [Paracoccaceae bacterium]|nr:DsbA family oxidoreductase [Paracoccaceae bacterium]